MHRFGLPSPVACLACFLSLLACSPHQATTSPAVPPPTTLPVDAPVDVRATAFIDELARGSWEHPQTAFAPAMLEAMPSDKLQALWGKLADAGGAFRSVEGTRVRAHGDTRIALVTCHFERLRKVLRVVFDQENRLVGLFYGPVPEDLEGITRKLIAAAAQGDFEGASQSFGSVLTHALPPSQLAEAWNKVVEKAGEFQSIESVELKPTQGYWSLLATCRFERERLVIRVVYDDRNEAVGLFVQPPAVAWAPPSYVQPDRFEERPVSVGVAPALPGTLSLPKAGGPFPAIVLVHGSGPNDEEETVGAVKVFKDLAWGLASRSIAVLRYVKRSRHAPAGIVTQKEEVLDAARDGIDLLRRTPSIDPQRVFLLGHSQGGYLAPRIAVENPGLAGIVVLAGSTRPLEDSIIAQYEYFIRLDPTNAALVAQLAEAKRFKETVEDPGLRSDQHVELPAGGRLRGAYFLDTRGYAPATVAATLPCRLLILQGERDYQVTMEDFAGWRSALASKKNVRFKSYPALNHLFVAGDGPSTPSEYEHPGHVDGAVIDDIADWISSQ